MLLARRDSKISACVIIVQLMQNIIQLAITMPELIARVKAAKRLLKFSELLAKKEARYELLNILPCP